MRPIFHFTERRIEAHICICFVAYKVYKELERVIRHAGIDMSVDKVLDIAKTIKHDHKSKNPTTRWSDITVTGHMVICLKKLLAVIFFSLEE